MNNNKSNRRSNYGRSVKILLTLVILGAVGWGVSKLLVKPEVQEEFLTTVPVQQGNLVIDVLEPGSIDAKESQIIKSEVEGQTRIITIVAEGTILSETDVLNKKILVELDSADMREKRDQQAITVQSASATYTDAKESLLIQSKLNESNIKTAELKIKFGLMDLKKYLGKEVAEFLVSKPDSNIPELVSRPDLGGDSLQKRRQFESDISLSMEDQILAREKLKWTVELEKKGYETAEKRKADELALKRLEVKQRQAETDLDLFQKYQFPKDAEKFFSDYQEAIRELERTEAKSRSEIAKANAKLMSGESNFKSESTRLDKLNEQIQKCTIIATKPGLVVYANGDWDEARIKEGETVRERQDLIRIPNTSTMIAKAKIHESIIARIKETQQAVVTVDAIPDSKFNGTVSKVALLPDSQNRWLNPNLKVFETEVSMNEIPPNMKPGMSAQVRIIIDELKNVVYVPIQAVTTKDGKKICYVLGALGAPQRREVETGDYNDKFIEIKSGLKVDEQVVLNIARLLEKGDIAAKKLKVKKGDASSVKDGEEPDKDKKEGDSTQKKGRGQGKGAKPEKSAEEKPAPEGQKESTPNAPS